jgi:hypothetical protein
VDKACEVSDLKYIPYLMSDYSSIVPFPKNHRVPFRMDLLSRTRTVHIFLNIIEEHNNSEILAYAAVIDSQPTLL